jgi:hypothetical protein
MMISYFGGISGQLGLTIYCDAEKSGRPVTLALLSLQYLLKQCEL